MIIVETIESSHDIWTAVNLKVYILYESSYNNICRFEKSFQRY